jgi:hypothetical protein
VDRHVLVLNDRRFRRAQARRLGLDLVTRLAWARKPRLCEVVREDGVLVARVETTRLPDERLADAELFRAATFVDALARPGEPVVLESDFDVSQSRTAAELAGPDWGFVAADGKLVRGLG